MTATRRDFLRASTLAGVAATAAAPAAATGAAVAKPSRSWRIALAPTIAAAAPVATFRRELARLATAPSINMQDGVAATDGIAVVAGRVAELYVGSEAMHVHHHPAFAIFGGLTGAAALPPMQFRSWLEAAAGQELWDELAAGFGIKALYLGSVVASPGAPGGLALSCGMRLADWNGLAAAERAQFVAAARAAVADAEVQLGSVLPDPRRRPVSSGSLQPRQASLADLPRDEPLMADIIASYSRALRMARMPGAAST